MLHRMFAFPEIRYKVSNRVKFNIVWIAERKREAAEHTCIHYFCGKSLRGIMFLIISALRGNFLKRNSQ